MSQPRSPEHAEGNLETHLLAQLDQSKDFFWHRLRWAAVKPWLPRDSGDLLDVGAGAGLLGEYLRSDRADLRYCFVEPLASLRAALAQRHGAEADWSDRDDWAGASVLTLLDVLEHQVDEQEFLSTVARRMRPGARLIVTVPALQALWSDWDVKLGHVRRYDRVGLARAVAGHGWQLRELSYLFPEMLAPAVVRALRNPRSSGAEFPVLPRPVNAALTALGTLSIRARRFAPLGTSLLCVLDKP